MENEDFLAEFKKYIADPKSRIILLAGVGLFSIAAILAVFFITNNNGISSKEFTEAQKIDQNPAQKNQILSEIIKNNPKTNVSPAVPTSDSSTSQSTFQGNKGYVRVDPITGIAENIESASTNPVGVGPEAQPDLTKYNFRKIITKTTPGDLSGICPNYYSPKATSTQTTSEYFDSENSYYTSKVDSEDGSLEGYYTSHYGVNDNETYNYQGGTFAIVTKYTPNWYSGGMYFNNSIDKPNVSFPTSYAAIQNYFGYGATIQRIFQTSGRSYYEVKMEYNNYCGGALPDSVSKYSNDNGLVPIISIQTIDAESYEIVGRKLYIGEVSPNNLIWAAEYNATYKTTDFNSVSNEFEQMFKDNIRIADWKNYVFSKVEYANRVANYMKDHNLSIIFPLNDDFSLFSMTVKNLPAAVVNADYYRDRNFYPAGLKGDEIYAQEEQNYDVRFPVLSYILTDKYNSLYFYINQFEEGAGYDKLLSNITSYSAVSTQYDSKLIINNEDIPVKIYQTLLGGYPYMSGQYPVSYLQEVKARFPISIPTSYPGYGQYTTETTTNKILFRYGDKIYSGEVPWFGMANFSDSSYQNYNIGEQIGFIKLLDLIGNGVSGGS
ncbi:MAG: hypothetical protein ABI721_01520 [Candidatus Dojkabacteria bacterium]